MMPKHSLGNSLRTSLTFFSPDKRAISNFLIPREVLNFRSFLNNGLCSLVISLTLNGLYLFSIKPLPMYQQYSYLPAACAASFALCFSLFLLRRRRLSSSRLLSIFLCLGIQILHVIPIGNRYHACCYALESVSSQLLSSEISGPFLP